MEDKVHLCLKKIFFNYLLNAHKLHVILNQDNFSMKKIIWNYLTSYHSYIYLIKLGVGTRNIRKYGIVFYVELLILDEENLHLPN